MPVTGRTFKPNEPSLQEVLENIHKGVIQLPDFQRGWVWDDDHIRSLIASVSLSYPIGAVMLLEMGGDGIRLKPRLVEGVSLTAPVSPDQLILDGQQRLTSLYLALRSGEAVPTRTAKGQEIERVYYLNITACLDPETDRLDAIIGVPPDRIIRSGFGRVVDLDLSAAEKEYELGFFPLARILDHGGCAEWRRGYGKFFSYDDQKQKLYDQFEEGIIQIFLQYRIPVIELLRGISKEAVCQVFEKVNTGGVTLTVFELLTATFAVDDFRLREDWGTREERLHAKRQTSGLDATQFLTTVTLLSSYQRHRRQNSAVSCKRRDVLNLTLEDYRECADEVERGYLNVARFLAREKVFDARNVPYETQLIPLSAICAVLGNRFEEDSVRQKLSRWYWCGVFGELYGGTLESRYAMDITDVLNWIDGGEEPRSVRDANFSPMRLLTLQSRLSAAYKGFMAQLMQVGSKDFISGDPIELTTFFDMAVDIHHIFPRDYCEKCGYPKKTWNSIVNKTPLSYRTNRILGGKAPSAYLAKIEKDSKVSQDRLGEILESHMADLALVRGDDYSAFLADRACKLLDLIEKAMGKPVFGRDSEEVVQVFGKSLVSGANAVGTALPTENLGGQQWLCTQSQ